jgi:uncharacterized membrane protein YwzB
MKTFIEFIIDFTDKIAEDDRLHLVVNLFGFLFALLTLLFVKNEYSDIVILILGILASISVGVSISAFLVNLLPDKCKKPKYRKS